MLSYRTHLAVFVGVALVLVLAACGRAAPAPTPTPVPLAAPTRAPAATPTPVAAPKPTGPKGKLTIGAKFARVEPIDPHTWMDGLVSVMSWNWTETLVRVNEKSEFAPGIATSWKTAPDGLSWDFEIRKDVKFHDGTPLTTKDVVFSFARELGFRETNATARVFFESIDRAEAVDAYRFKVITKGKYAPLLTDLLRNAHPLPKDYIEKVGDKEFAAKPVGTGPFKIASKQPGIRMDFVAFEGHFERIPFVKDFHYLVVPEDTTRAAMLNTGEVDIAEMLPHMLAKVMGATPGLRLDIMKKAILTDIFFSVGPGKDEMFFDKRVRQAVAYSIDRESLVKDIYFGYGSPAACVCFPFTVGAPDIKPYPYDPDKAKALLAEAGFPNGIKTKWYAGSNTADAINLGLALAGYWKKAGIQVEVVPMETLAWNKEVQQRTLGGGISSHGPGGKAFAGDGGLAAERYYGSYAVYNTDLKRPDVDELIGKQKTIMDPGERDKVLNQLYRTVHEDAIHIGVAYQDWIWGLGPRVASWTHPQDPWIGRFWETVKLKD